jgi:tellurite methyltransferase
MNLHPLFCLLLLTASGCSSCYLVDEAMLMQMTTDLGAELVDPVRTTVVQNLRSMTTWVLRK